MKKIRDVWAFLLNLNSRYDTFSHYSDLASFDLAPSDLPPRKATEVGGGRPFLLPLHRLRARHYLCLVSWASLDERLHAFVEELSVCAYDDY
jgi:hypothetical protein